MSKLELPSSEIAARVHLTAQLDERGNLMVPAHYAKEGQTSCRADVETFDTPAAVATSAAVLLNLASKNDTRPVSPPAAMSEANDRGVCDVYIDTVSGVPYHARCVRVLVYLLKDMVEVAQASVTHSVTQPQLFMRAPDKVIYQNIHSSPSRPQFEDKFTLSLSDASFVVFIVEFIVDDDAKPVTLGHVCFPLSTHSRMRNHLTRLRLGDPRRSQERDTDDMRPVERITAAQTREVRRYTQSQLEASVNAQALRNMLFQFPTRRSQCVPMGFLAWRLHSKKRKAPFFTHPRELPLSAQEVTLHHERTMLHSSSPATRGIADQKHVDTSFVGSAEPLGLHMSYLVPFNPRRGLFMSVHSVRGLSAAEAALYMVGVAMPLKGGKSSMRFATLLDWESDVGALHYRDEVSVFKDMQYDVHTIALFALFKITPRAASVRPDDVRQSAVLSEFTVEVSAENQHVYSTIVGWTAMKLFLPTKNALRQGRYALPWINGPPSPSLCSALSHQKFDEVFVSAVMNKNIVFMHPPASLTVIVGDPTCVPQLMDDTPGRVPIQDLLVPGSMARTFPKTTSNGVTGVSLCDAARRMFGAEADSSLIDKVMQHTEKSYRINNLNLFKVTPNWHSGPFKVE